MKTQKAQSIANSIAEIEAPLSPQLLIDFSCWLDEQLEEFETTHRDWMTSRSIMQSLKSDSEAVSR